MEPFSPPESTTTPLPTRLAWALGVAALAALLVVGCCLGNHTVADQDLLLHDRAGLDMLGGAGVPHANAYSFTAPDHPWVDHEWLFQLVVALAGNARGATVEARAASWHALTLALAATLSGLLLLGDGALARLRGGRGPAPALLLAALPALAMLWTRLQLRPELVSLVLFVLVLRQVEAALATEDDGQLATTRWRDLVDPRRPAGRAAWLTVLWAQLHGFYLLAAAVWLAVGLTTRGVRGARGARPSRTALAAAGAGAAILAGLLTPNHVHGLLYPLRVLRQYTGDGPDLSTTISELAPLVDAPDGLHLTIAAFTASVVWGVVWAVVTWGRVPRGRVLLWAVAAFAAWQGQRNLGFYAVTFVLLHTRVAPGPAWPRRRWAWTQRVASLEKAVAVAAPLAVVASCALWGQTIVSSRFYLHEGESRRWGAGLTPANYPLRQAAALPAGQRVANNVDAASTLIRVAAGAVCIDGRTEAYPPAAWREYATMRAGGDDALTLLGRWQVQAVVLAHRSQAAHPLLRTLWQAPAWRLTSADEAGVTFVPTNASLAPAAEVLRREATAFAAGLPPRGRRDVRAADRCAAWAALLNLVGEEDLARGLLDRAQGYWPDHPVVLHNLGNQFLAAGDAAAAAPLFRRAAALNPRAAGSWLNAGVCAFRLGRADDATRWIGRATRLSPRWFEAWANLAEVRRAGGDAAGARRAYAKALALRDDPRLRARAAELSSPRR